METTLRHIFITYRQVLLFLHKFLGFPKIIYNYIGKKRILN